MAWHRNSSRTKITSRETLATETGLSIRQVRTALEKLQKLGEIVVKNDQQIYSCNYCKLWVLSIQQRKTTNNRPSNDHQTTNNRPQYNKDNNNNKDNKNNRLNKIKLNSLYLFINKKNKNFEGLNETDRIP